ncbi:MAG: PPOX class F420-dependent oxidoreductase [Marmoricola sp.]
MDLDTGVELARTRTKSVLVTQGRNGRPQLSNVMHHVGQDGVVRISITSSRVKYQNLVREPWAALHVTSDDFWSWVVLEGDVVLTPVAKAPDDATVEELVALYRGLAGEHPDWVDYRASMVAEGRVVVRLTPGRAYGQLQS